MEMMPALQAGDPGLNSRRVNSFLPHGIMNTMRYSEGSMSLHSR